MQASKLPSYPRGVFVMATIQLLMMIGFMMIFALLVLYLTKDLHFSNDQAYNLNAAYNALIFATPVLGGFLGAKYFGYRFAIIISSILSILGLITLSFPGTEAMYLGLSLFICGTGISVPCMYVLLGRLYHKDDSRRDSGFTVSYIGMNVGAFIASFSSGFIEQKFGFHLAFLLCAFSSFLMLMLFIACQKLFTKQANSATTDVSTPKPQLGKSQRLQGILFVALAIPVVILLLKHSMIANYIMISLGAVVALIIIRLALKEDAKSRNRMFAFLILCIISIAFWALYMLSPGVMVIFAQHNVDRSLFGFSIPPSDVTSLDPFFIVTIGPILSAIWLWLTKRGVVISTSAKFATGVTLMGVGYLVMALGIHHANVLGFTAFSWVILSYFFQTLGELFLSPVGYAMVGTLAPSRLEGLMMGIWQLAVGVAGALSGFLAGLTTTPNGATSPLVTNTQYGHAFLFYGSAAAAVGIFAIYLVPKIQGISGHADKVALARTITS